MNCSTKKTKTIVLTIDNLNGSECNKDKPRALLKGLRKNIKYLLKDQETSTKKNVLLINNINECKSDMKKLNCLFIRLGYNVIGPKINVTYEELIKDIRIFNEEDHSETSIIIFYGYGRSDSIVTSDNYVIHFNELQGDFNGTSSPNLRNKSKIWIRNLHNFEGDIKNESTNSTYNQAKSHMGHQEKMDSGRISRFKPVSDSQDWDRCKQEIQDEAGFEVFFLNMIEGSQFKNDSVLTKALCHALTCVLKRPLVQGIKSLDIKVKQVENQNIQGPDKGAYRNESDPRGALLIANYRTFLNKMISTRSGSETDVRNLKKLFSQMGYDYKVVEGIEDGTKDETMKAMQKFSQHKIHNEVDSLVVVIMSHGTSGDIFITSDDQQVSSREIYEIFNDKNCPALKGKPKLFIYKHCRGENIPFDVLTMGPQSETALEIRRKPRAKNISDIFLNYSTGHEMKCPRYGIGSPYIYQICRVFMQNACKNPLTILMKEVDEEMDKYCLKCEYREPGRRTHDAFFFNPKCIEYNDDHYNNNNNNGNHSNDDHNDNDINDDSNNDDSSDDDCDSSDDDCDNDSHDNYSNDHNSNDNDDNEDKGNGLISKMNSSAEKLVLLINNLDGCDEDMVILKALFTDLGYMVIGPEKNVNYEKFKGVIKEFKEKDHNESTFVFFYGDGFDDYIVTSDHYAIHFNELQREFNDINCPNLRNKSKIFITNLCFYDGPIQFKPTNMGHPGENDSDIQDWELRDMFFLVVEIEGSRCTTGSLLTTALDQALRQHESPVQLMKIMRDVSRKLYELQDENQDDYVCELRTIKFTSDFIISAVKTQVPVMEQHVDETKMAQDDLNATQGKLKEILDQSPASTAAATTATADSAVPASNAPAPASPVPVMEQYVDETKMALDDLYATHGKLKEILDQSPASTAAATTATADSAVPASNAPAPASPITKEEIIRRMKERLPKFVERRTNPRIPVQDTLAHNNILKRKREAGSSKSEDPESVLASFRQEWKRELERGSSFLNRGSIGGSVAGSVAASRAPSVRSSPAKTDPAPPSNVYTTLEDIRPDVERQVLKNTDELEESTRKIKLGTRKINERRRKLQEESRILILEETEERIRQRYESIASMEKATRELNEITQGKVTRTVDIEKVVTSSDDATMISKPVQSTK